MARRKRPSELLRQLRRRLAAMDECRAKDTIIGLAEDHMARLFFQGCSIEFLSKWAEREWPHNAETAVRHSVNRRDRSGREA